MSDLDLLRPSPKRVSPDMEKNYEEPKRDRVRTKTSTISSNLHSGDCEMEAGSHITFNDDGTGRFTSRVKTNHTHSGDNWHQAFACKNALGAVLFTLGQWDGPRMDDDHGYYDWVIDFAWNQSFFDALDNVDWYYSC